MDPDLRRRYRLQSVPNAPRATVCRHCRVARMSPKRSERARAETVVWRRVIRRGTDLGADHRVALRRGLGICLYVLRPLPAPAANARFPARAFSCVWRTRRPQGRLSPWLARLFWWHCFAVALVGSATVLVTAIVVLIVIAFALARSAGNSAALADFAEQRSTDYAAYPRVRVIREGAESSADVVADIGKTDCGRLLAANKDRLFLIRSVRGAGSIDLDTFVLPAEKAIVRIEAGVHKLSVKRGSPLSPNRYEGRRPVRPPFPQKLAFPWIFVFRSGAFQWVTAESK